MKRLFYLLTVIGFMAMISLAVSCASSPQKPTEELVYRGQIPDSVYLQQQDIERIAELVTYRQALSDYKREQSNLLLKISGTLIMLLLAGLMWFLRGMLINIPKLQTEVQKLSLVIAKSEQWNKNQKLWCDERYKQLNERIEHLEK